MAKSSKVAVSKRKAAATPSDANRKKIFRITAIGLVVLFVLNLLSGVISYGAMTVWCMRLPITAHTFGYHYFQPGEAYYGPGPFAKYYCTEQDAGNAGFKPSPWRDR